MPLRKYFVYAFHIEKLLWDDTTQRKFILKEKIFMKTQAHRRSWQDIQLKYKLQKYHGAEIFILNIRYALKNLQK